MPRRIKLFLSLYFPIKFYLKRDISFIVIKYKFFGNVLDFGCGQKPFSGLFKNSEYLGIDFEDYSINKDFPKGKPDYFFDEEYEKNLIIPFEDENFDHIVSFQVLEHHPDPGKMISELSRIVKKGGFMMVTFPFISSLHEVPRDYQRITEYGIRNIFEKNNCKILEIKKQGALFSAIFMLISEEVNGFAAKNKFNYFISGFFYLPILLLGYASLFADNFIKTKKTFINYLILAKKL